MALLNTADAIYVGDLAADAVYMGDALVWSAAAAVLGSYEEEVLADGPFTYFPLGDVAGPPVDQMGVVVPATYAGVTFGALTVGDRGTAVSMSGANGSNGVRFPSSSFAVPAAFTVEILASFNALTASLRKLVYFPGLFAIQDLTVTDVGAYINTATGGNLIGSYPLPNPTDVHHFAISWDGTTGVFYVDGVAVDSAVKPLGALGANFGIGTDPTQTARNMNGRFGGFAYYDKLLSPTRIQAHADAGLAGVAAWAPAALPGCVMALNAADAPVGAVVSWPDRSPAHNDMLAWHQNTDPVIGNGSFVTLKFATTYSWDAHMVSTAFIGALAGNHSSHTLFLSRHRGVSGTFLSWGGSGGGTAFDFWDYADGTLIWHGSGPGFDTIPGPPLPLNAWVLIDVSYDATTGTITVCVDEMPPDTLTGLVLNTADSQFWLGVGSYSPGSDYDLAELYVYDRVLTVEERAAVRAHLYDLIPTRLAWL